MTNHCHLIVQQSPLKTKDILASLEVIGGVRAPETELHLLGITRFDSMEMFADLGVTSFDSTSAFRQAFMDDRKNFHTVDDAFVAIRVPQVDGNPTLKRAILSGQVSQRDAIAQERACLAAVRACDGTEATAHAALRELGAYETICQSKKSYLAEYARTLSAAPWASCPCTLCRDLGIEIAIFRGTERNKRRGFHNLSVLSRKMSTLQPRTMASTSRSEHG